MVPIFLVTLTAHHTRTVTSCNGPSQINMPNHMHFRHIQAPSLNRTHVGYISWARTSQMYQSVNYSCLNWRKCNGYIVLHADEKKTPISYARLASDFSERSLGTNLVQFTSANVFYVFSYYPECKLLFKTSYTYTKTPISHFCGDQLKRHKIQKVSNLRNIVLMGIWLGPYKKHINLRKTQNARTWNWGFTVFVNCCPIWRVTSDNLWPNLRYHLSEICSVCALYKNMLFR